MTFDPNQPDNDDSPLDYFLVGTIKYLEVLIKLPGLFLLQYLFFWNWKRIIDPNSRQVIATGLATWAIVVLVAALVVKFG